MNASHRVVAAMLTGLGALTLASATLAANAPGAGDESELSEVVVTGSRVITNGNDSPSPVTVVTLEDLQATHPTTVFEALEELPQFSAGRGGALGGNTGAGGNNNSIAGLNLRALGSLRSLVLFDGHRVPPQNLDGQVGLNQVPQMMLQRVDVQTGGASAVYGSDGITGVINFITDRKFNGIKTNAQFGISEQNDNKAHELGIAAGTDLFGGRGHLEGSVQSHHDEGLYRGDRSYIQAPDASYWSLEGNGTTVAPYFLTQNARDSSQTYGGKIVGPATVAGRANPLLNMNFASNGVLTPFVDGSTQGLTGTGSTQIGGQGGLAFQHVTLKAPIDMVQLFSRFDFELTDNLHYFAAAFYNIEDQYTTFGNVRSNVAATTALGSGMVLSRDNAFLPATYTSQLQAAGFTTFNVGKIWSSDFYPEQSYDYHMHNAYLNTGLEGKFGNGWHWETSVTRSRAIQANTANNTWNTGRLFAALDAVVNPANGQIVCQVSLTANAGLYPGCVPMNVFGPTATTQAMWDYVRMPTHYQGTTDLMSAEGYVSGAPFGTWAGPVNMALSGEWRKLEYLLISGGEPANVAPLSCTGLRFNCVAPSATNIGSSQIFTNGTAGTALGQAVTQTVKELALEADLPLLKNLPFAQEVGVNVAGRRAEYSSDGTPVASVPRQTVTFAANTWKVGLSWHINDSVTLRGTRSRDFRAPNLGDLFVPGRVQGFTLGLDRLTGATNVLAQQQIGGNPDLKPEVGYTTTVGVVVKPWEAFSFAVDAYAISIADAIANINGSSAIYQDDCYASGGTSAFCSLQVRPLGNYTNTTAANTATRWYTTQPINIAEIRTQGLDVETNYKLSLRGHPLTFRALVTYQPHVWTLQPLSNTTDAGGVGSPRVRALASAHFNATDRFTVDWSTRWRSSLKNVDPRNLNTNVVPGSGDVASVFYSNMTLNYNVSQFTHGKLTAYMNVLNVFNQIPPIYSGSGAVSYYAGDDAIGRYYNVGVRLRL